MSVLVDTCVWSQVLRRRKSKPDQWTKTLTRLIQEGRASIIGPIRQEILSGIREHAQFVRLRDTLRNFPDCILRRTDYERAAEILNICRRKGIQGSNTDFLICAYSERHEMPILTMDKDFNAFSAVVPIRVVQIDSFQHSTEFR